MRRTTLALVAVAAVLAIAVAAGGVAAQDSTDDGDNESAVAPGERLAGVIGVQAAEFEGEMANRTYGVKVAQAASANAKAEVVARQLRDVEERIERIEQRKAELKQAHENGSLSEGAYRAQMAELEAERATAERLADSTNRTASGLPTDVLEANGVNASAIQLLQDRAAQLTGPEVAQIARSIAGPNVGAPAVRGSGGAPGDVGPGDAGPGNRTEYGNETDVGVNDSGPDGVGDEPGSDAGP